MYVFQLPFPKVKALSEILDFGHIWENLAAIMPGIAMNDILACRQAPIRQMSPSEELLKLWGTKGYTVDQLYKLLAKVRNIRAMSVIKELVDEKYHNLEWNLIKNCSTNVKKEQININPVHSAILDSKSSDSSNSLLNSLQNTPSVTYEELLKITDHFSVRKIIGRGGFGVVYKGEWKLTQVAVKRIQAGRDTTTEREREKIRQSLMELRTLAMYRHDNILPLYGYSLNGPESCLIYQFMSGGSLQDRLSNKTKSASSLTWDQRKSIAKGTGCGLHFLHTIKVQPLIHGDVKSANILLDGYDQPKLGDFGLSRMGRIEIGLESSPIVASHIQGTLAYLPPEFLTNKHLSTKLDVFSYGVVLLEMCTGLRAYSENRSPRNLLDYVMQKKGNEDEQWDELPDKAAGTDDPGIFDTFSSLAFLCCHRDPNIRPIFAHIIDRLN